MRIRGQEALHALRCRPPSPQLRKLLPQRRHDELHHRHVGSHAVQLRSRCSDFGIPVVTCTQCTSSYLSAMPASCELGSSPAWKIAKRSGMNTYRPPAETAKSQPTQPYWTAKWIARHNRTPWGMFDGGRRVGRLVAALAAVPVGPGFVALGGVVLTARALADLARQTLGARRENGRRRPTPTEQPPAYPGPT